jgi:5'-3' exonuclease
MGIPYYFYNLVKKYKNIVIDKIPIDISIYAIDFNGIIHPQAHKETNEEKLFANLWNKINSYNELYKPEKMLICVDGVAPVAKIIQQRKRRYLSIYKNKIDNITSKWDTNAISAGTTFMNNLDDFIFKKINDDKLFIFDGSKNQGEGEHKIFNYLKSLDFDKSKGIIINGLDADLIILSLLSNIDNIYLMRENDDNISYLDINELKKSLLEELKLVWTHLDDIQIIESYCVMCSILGNDFIPNIISLNMKNKGLMKIIDFTTKAIVENGSLIIDGKINKECLKEIFFHISNTEDTSIFEDVSNEIQKKPRDFTLKSQEYGIKNKDNLLREIYSNNKKWRYLYYKSLFDINIQYDTSMISTVIENYLTGIYWTYNYYKGFDLDYDWYYPYNYSPTSKDIYNYLNVNDMKEIRKNGSFLHPKIQLFLILPIQSNHLLDDNFKILTTDIKKGYKHLFPIEFKIQTFLKNHLHECLPILPILDIGEIRKINNISDEL